jgi:hypothetical protein
LTLFNLVNSCGAANSADAFQIFLVGLITAAVGAGIVNFLGGTDPAVRNIGVLVTVSSILFIILGYVLYMWRGGKTKRRGKFTSFFSTDL